MHKVLMISEQIKTLSTTTTRHADKKESHWVSKYEKQCSFSSNGTNLVKGKNEFLFK